jgi:magnesium chelatase family protein
MLAAVRSAAVLGIDAFPVLVEVDVALGLPAWTIVGLAAGAVKESRERVSAALANSGFAIPPRRITVNLAPADVRKEGTSYDLPIALALLVATGQLDADAVRDLLAIGELGLDGGLRPVRGTLPVARHAAAVDATLLLPPANVAEARLAGGARLAAPATFAALVAELRAGALAPPPACDAPMAACEPLVDLADVIGQEAGKRALEIVAAGDHGVSLVASSPLPQRTSHAVSRSRIWGRRSTRMPSCGSTSRRRGSASLASMRRRSTSTASGTSRSTSLATTWTRPASCPGRRWSSIWAASATTRSRRGRSPTLGPATSSSTRTATGTCRSRSTAATRRSSSMPCPVRACEFASPLPDGSVRVGALETFAAR